MSPAFIEIEAQEDRVPPCLFPIASLPTNNERAELVSQHLLLEKTLTDVESLVDSDQLTIPIALQTAWALTLRCFAPSDVLIFAYCEDDKSSTCTSTLIGRVDQTEMMAVCLQQFKDQLPISTLAAPAGFAIHRLDGQPSRELCNTRLHYRNRDDGSGRALDPTQEDLTLTVCKQNGQLRGSIAFYHNVITEAIGSSVLQTFKHILSQILRGPHNHVATLCSDADRATIKLLTQSISSPHDRCVHDIIIEQCKAHPERMAVQSWDGDLTYGELDDLSLRLAHHLVALGVGPEKYVLSCFEKSTWAIVARLAVLRAGGAYISVLATNPPLYLDSVVKRTDAQFLLSDAKFGSRFKDLCPTFVGVTPQWLRSLPLNHDTPCDTVRPDNACLVLFTSGSTGQPKGIVQVHQSYATSIKDYVHNFHLDSTTRFLHFDDYAFDISNLEFFVPLFVGGCCCVPPPMKTADDLVSAIRSLNANIAFLTPTVAVKLDPADVPSLRTICVGGEPLPRELITKYKSSGTHLVNQFGMGEVAICCAYNNNIQLNRGNTIGIPATGAIWIVDPSSPERLLPIGAVGELVIEGPHLSRRYLDNTAVSRTGAGFLTKPPRWMSEMHPDRIATRLYRSGDLGRLNADGTLDYIGRKDTILKLDGCRIDAVEVEHQARKCLSPSDAIIVDLLGAIDGNEDPKLTALLYLDDHPNAAAPVANGEPAITNAADDDLATEKVNAIQHAIRSVLPPYMVPSAYFLVSWVPRTASKKTDRKKIRVIAQRYYMAERKMRSKSPFFVQQGQMLPP